MGVGMVSGPRYLIAKYIPDLIRMEPRNIGVVVWSLDGIEARFLGEKPNHPGNVDGRSLPAFISNLGAYKQWLRFWRTELAKEAVDTISGDDAISRTSPAFLEALMSWNKGNFVLNEGGYGLDYVEADDLGEFTDYLYRMLVDTSDGDEVQDPTLDELCDEIIKEAHLQKNPNFQSAFKVECPIADRAQARVVTYEFSHAYKNGSLQRLYQRVPLSRRKTVLRKTVHDSAWMFEKVIQRNIISASQGGVLVHLNEEDQQDKDVLDALKELESVTRVLNIADHAKTLHEFKELAAWPVHT